MNKVMVSMALALLLTASSGCRTTGDAVPSGVVFIGGKALSKRISVEKTGGVLMETGTRKVWASLHNRSKARMTVEVRAIFMGDNDEPLESETAWRRMFIESGTTTLFDALSKTTTAKKVTIEIREGNL